MFDEQQKYNKLLHITQTISSIRNIDDLFNTIISYAAEITNAECGYLFIKDDADLLQLKASFKELQLESSFSHEIIDEVYKNNETIVVTDSDKNIKYEKSRTIATLHKGSIMCSPLQYLDKIIGVCYLEKNMSQGTFQTEDMEIIQAIAAQATIAIENALLYSQVEKKVKERTVELSETNKRLKQIMNDSSILVSHIGHKFHNELWPFAQMVMLTKKLLEESQKNPQILNKDIIENALQTICSCENSLSRIEEMKKTIKKNFGRSTEKKNYTTTYIINEISKIAKNISQKNKFNVIIKNYINQELYIKLNIEQLHIAVENLFLIFIDIIFNKVDTIPKVLHLNFLYEALNFKINFDVADDGYLINMLENINQNELEDQKRSLDKIELNIFISRWIIIDCHKGKMDLYKTQSNSSKCILSIPQGGTQ